jgi:hypothetical protein
MIYGVCWRSALAAATRDVALASPCRAPVLPRDEDEDVVFLSGLIQQNGKWVGLGRCVVMVLGWLVGCVGLARSR